MKNGPNVAAVAALVGDPARANMLTALMSGKALTATELAQEAGVTASTASAHLARLEQGGLVVPQKQGRHRYFRLSGPDVAGVLEGLMGLAARTGHMRLRTGPREPAMRAARTCYDHLAGDVAVSVFDGLVGRSFLFNQGDAVRLTQAGRAAFAGFGIDVAGLERSKRPLCTCCLDWSERRSHLGGALGAALLDQITTRGWVDRELGSRIVRFTPRGRARLLAAFGPLR